MSLKNCAECGKLISTEARFCVHCGNEPCDEFACSNCRERSENPDCGSSHGVCPAFRVEVISWGEPFNPDADE